MPTTTGKHDITMSPFTGSNTGLPGVSELDQSQETLVSFALEPSSKGEQFKLNDSKAEE